jgi:hypothetical protein
VPDYEIIALDGRFSQLKEKMTVEWVCKQVDLLEFLPLLVLQPQIQEVISGIFENGLWFDHLTKGKRETVSSFS